MRHIDVPLQKPQPLPQPFTLSQYEAYKEKDIRYTKELYMMALLGQHMQNSGPKTLTRKLSDPKTPTRKLTTAFE